MGVEVRYTDLGREWLARHQANYANWTNNLSDGDGNGYKLYKQMRWGEGGWKIENGRRIPKDPSNFLGNDDIEILQNPQDYGDRYYYTNEGSTDTPDFIDIDDNEKTYIGGSTEIFRIILKIDETEENVIEYVDPNDSSNDRTGESPRLYEVGIFDNAYDINQNMSAPPSPFDSVTKNNLILYCTFDGFAKNSQRTHKITLDIPFKP